MLYEGSCTNAIQVVSSRHPRLFLTGFTLLPPAPATDCGMRRHSARAGIRGVTVHVAVEQPCRCWLLFLPRKSLLQNSCGQPGSSALCPAMMVLSHMARQNGLLLCLVLLLAAPCSGNFLYDCSCLCEDTTYVFQTTTGCSRPGGSCVSTGRFPTRGARTEVGSILTTSTCRIEHAPPRITGACWCARY